MNNSYKKQLGVSLVEVLIAASIILIFIVSLVSAYNLYKTLSFSNADTIKAAYIAEEGIEAVKTMRDASWSTNILPLSNDVAYYLAFVGGKWTLTTSPVNVDGVFTRRIVFAALNRDASGNIVSSGGAVDAGSRKVTVTVSWTNQTGSVSKSISTYITNLFNN